MKYILIAVLLAAGCQQNPTYRQQPRSSTEWQPKPSQPSGPMGEPVGENMSVPEPEPVHIPPVEHEPCHSLEWCMHSRSNCLLWWSSTICTPRYYLCTGCDRERWGVAKEF